MMKPLMMLAVGAVMSGFAMFGCLANPDGTVNAAQTACTPNVTVECACPGGAKGNQTCNPQGTQFTSGCVCQACVPGTTQACACPGGGTGTQVCTAQASGFGACGGCPSTGTGGSGSPSCPAGSQGCACYANSTCNAGLSCSNGSCVASTSPSCPAGSQGCACYANSTCNSGLTCSNGSCVTSSSSCSPGTQGCACFADSTCNSSGLTCSNNTCVTNGTGTGGNGAGSSPNSSSSTCKLTITHTNPLSLSDLGDVRNIKTLVEGGINGAWDTLCDSNHGVGQMSGMTYSCTISVPNGVDFDLTFNVRDDYGDIKIDLPSRTKSQYALYERLGDDARVANCLSGFNASTGRCNVPSEAYRTWGVTTAGSETLPASNFAKNGEATGANFFRRLRISC